MKVILTETVTHLGEAGTIAEVKNGFARNYLLPRGLAKAATSGAIKAIEQQRAAEQRRIGILEDENRSLAEQIAAQVVHIQAKVGTNGRLYGSITAANIADALSEKLGTVIDRRKVELDTNIHTVGEFSVVVRLVGKLVPSFKVIVEAEGTPETETAPAEVTSDSVSDEAGTTDNTDTDEE